MAAHLHQGVGYSGTEHEIVGLADQRDHAAHLDRRLALMGEFGLDAREVRSTLGSKASRVYCGLARTLYERTFASVSNSRQGRTTTEMGMVCR